MLDQRGRKNESNTLEEMNMMLETEPLTKPQVEVLESIVEAVKQLYSKHATAIDSVRDETADKVVNVSFGVKIDGNEAAVKVRTRIRYSQTVIDEVIEELGDPNQPDLFTDEKEEGVHVE